MRLRRSAASGSELIVAAHLFTSLIIAWLLAGEGGRQLDG
jgi:hypothetical protein